MILNFFVCSRMRRWEKSKNFMEKEIDHWSWKQKWQPKISKSRVSGHDSKAAVSGNLCNKKDFDKVVLVCFILANKHSQSKVYEYCSAVDGTKCQMKCPGSVLYSWMCPTLDFKVMNLLQEFVRCCSLLGRSIFCLDPSFRSVRKTFLVPQVLQ